MSMWSFSLHAARYLFDSGERVERFDAELHVLASLTRPAASVQPAPLVRALLDAQAAKETNLGCC